MTMPDPTPKPVHRRPAALGGMRALRHRDFALFWASRVLGMLAIEMQITTVGWQVYRLTGRELDLGFVGLAQFAPFALLFLVSGLCADRFSRVRIVLACFLLQTMCAGTLFGMTWADAADFAPIIVVLVLLGVARAFQAPAQQAVVPNLVPPQDLANAIAWQSSGFQMARIMGPTIAGLMIAFGASAGFGETPIYAAVTIIFVCATAMILMVRSRVQVPSRAPLNLDTILGGLRFILTRQVLFAVIALDLFAVLFGGALALLPIYAKDILQVGAEGFGLLRSAFTAGSFIGALVLTQRPIGSHAGPKLLLAVGIFGAGVIVFGVSKDFYLSLAALSVMGVADSISVYVRQNLVQIITPDDMRGRVSAVNTVFIGASNELGEFESGVTAHWWGTVPAVVVGGSVTVGVAVVWAAAFPKLRAIDTLDPDELIRQHRGPHS